MSTMRSHQEKVALDAHIRHLYAIKMQHLPKSLFANGRKPTLYDIINETEACRFLDGVPREYDLKWYFENHDKLARLGFKARKGANAEERALNRAIWFLGIDPKHTFSTKISVSRFNMLCVLIVYALPNPDRVCDFDTNAFCRHFRFAWSEAIEHNSDYWDTMHQDGLISYWEKHEWDVISWGAAQMTRMKKAVANLQTVVPELPFPIEHYWAEADLQPEDEREQKAALWAMRWLIHMDTEAQLQHQRAEAEILENEWHVQEMADQIAALGADELDYLNDPYVDDLEILSALRVPVDESIQPLPPQEHTMWMSPSTAIDMVEGRIQDVDKIVQALATMDL